ncbi:hypothetical protein Q5692_18245 [Microcoleus sp. C2C3]|uniref:hypothetical protein n=1 Tax=unclassified Microcoleus TaxID=2642155 RepID=UPI002FD3F255
MTLIIDPTLDLFLYHKRDAGSDEQTEIANNQAYFTDNFPDNLKPNFDLETTADSTEYLVLLKQSQAPDIEDGGYKITASYYAVLLADTYGLFYTSSLTNDTTPQDISCLPIMKKQIIQKTGDIGRTWMISACLQNGDCAETVAKNIYQTSFSGDGWKNKQQGKFLEGDIFEIYQNPPDGKSREESHVLIILFPTPTDKANLGKLTKVLMQLLCFRHKVFWAYQKTRESKQELQKVYQSIRNTINDFGKHFIGNELTSEQLGKLEKILKTNLANFYDYGNQLNYLETYKQTIEVNLHNYKQALQNIGSKAAGLGESNLIFLDIFTDLVEQKYYKQIEKDYASLSPGLNMLENLINTIRGIVEIEQAQSNRRIEIRDRQFQSFVAVAGVGVATASLTATAVAPVIQQITTPLPNETTSKANHSGFIWTGFFLLCLILGVVSGGIAYWARSRQHSSSN